jgi:hypothetical protein
MRLVVKILTRRRESTRLLACMIVSIHSPPYRRISPRTAAFRFRSVTTAIPPSSSSRSVHVRSAISRTVIAPAVLAMCGFLGCSAADNPKMPEVPATTVKADTEVPKAASGGPQPYGASKKYQDSMPK